MQKVYYANTNQKQASLTLEKRTSEQETRVVCSVLQDDTIILHNYVHNNRTSKYMSQNLVDMQEKLDKMTISYQYTTIRIANNIKNVIRIENNIKNGNII